MVQTGADFLTLPLLRFLTKLFPPLDIFVLLGVQSTKCPSPSVIDVDVESVAVVLVAQMLDDESREGGTGGR